MYYDNKFICFQVIFLYQNMQSSASFTESLSITLNSILNRTGLSSFVRGHRLYYAKQEEWLHNLIFADANVKCFIMGSRMEGTTTPEAESDTDIIECYSDMNVVQNYYDININQSFLNARTFTDQNTHPGYVKLELCLPNDQPQLRTKYIEALQSTPFGEHIRIDEQNRILLANSYARRTENCDQLSGPARTEQFKSKFYNKSVDRVFAFKSSSWPDQAKDWLEKANKKPWPTGDALGVIKQCGFFVTPTGHPFSPDSDLEWRLSLSLAEKGLIWSFNDTQFKCFVLLKLITKQIVNPVHDDCISTYHSKMCMFSVIEDSDSDLWKPHNLLRCLEKCLIRFKVWIEARNIPQYLIPSNNLLEHKVNENQRQDLHNLYQTMLDSKFRFILQIRTDNIGELLTMCLTRFDQLLTYIPCELPYRMLTLICSLPLESVALFLNWRLKMLCMSVPEHGDSNIDVVIQYHFKRLKQLSNSIEEFRFSNTLQHPMQLMEFLIPHVASSLGFQLLVKGLECTTPKNTGMGFLRMGFEFIEMGMGGASTSNLLKLAALFHECKMVEKMGVLLKEVHDRYSKKVFPMCKCYEHPMHLLEDYAKHFYKYTLQHILTKCLAPCIVYLPTEELIAPFAIKLEMFRSSGCQLDDLSDSQYKNIGVCDSIIFMHYLTFLYNHEIGDSDQMDTAIILMLDTLSRETNLGHRDAAWNLLGHCSVMKNDFAYAFHCFIQSMSIRVEADNPRYQLRNNQLNNAAKWHIALLCYRLLTLKDEGCSRS